LPAATAAQVLPKPTFQFSSSSRLRPPAFEAAISSGVGNSSSARWYACRMSLPRPVFSSNCASAREAGRSVYAPGATPHSTPQAGVRSARTVQVASGFAGCAGRCAGSVAVARVAVVAVAEEVVGAAPVGSQPGPGTAVRLVRASGLPPVWPPAQPASSRLTARPSATTAARQLIRLPYRFAG
jgi:hypothetical protein